MAGVDQIYTAGCCWCPTCGETWMAHGERNTWYKYSSSIVKWSVLSYLYISCSAYLLFYFLFHLFRGVLWSVSESLFLLCNEFFHPGSRLVNQRLGVASPLSQATSLAEWWWKSLRPGGRVFHNKGFDNVGSTKSDKSGFTVLALHGSRTQRLCINH